MHPSPPLNTRLNLWPIIPLWWGIQPAWWSWVRAVCTHNGQAENTTQHFGAKDTEKKIDPKIGATGKQGKWWEGGGGSGGEGGGRTPTHRNLHRQKGRGKKLTQTSATLEEPLERMAGGGATHPPPTFWVQGLPPPPRLKPEFPLVGHT